MDALLTAVADALDQADEPSDTPGVERFYDDPVGFAEKCIAWPAGKCLASYQREVLAAIPVKRRVSVRGPHGLGKTSTTALAILWFALTRDQAGRDWKCVTTAGAWRQLIQYLWPEIHKWARLIRWDEVGRGALDPRSELLTLTLKLRHGSAFAVASDNAELIEGAHADSVMYVFDESKAIAADTFDAAEGAFSGAGEGSTNEAYALAMSTPGEPNGRFYDIHRRAPGLNDWWPRHVTKEEAIAAGRISREWCNQRRDQWGDSAVYHNRVEGEFHSSDEDGVIPLSWVEAANERWRAWDEAGRPHIEGPRAVGVDVARSGSDKTVLAIRHGMVITELRHAAKEDTMQTTGRTKGLLDANPNMHAVVDVIGIGAGVVDRLREQRYQVEGFNASEATTRRDVSGELGFTNRRSASWWNLRELLDPDSGHDVALPPDDLLTGDLTAPHWRVMSGGRIQVESKADIKKRIGRSTDDGDGVAMALWDGDDASGRAWIEHYRRKAEASATTADEALVAAEESPAPAPIEDAAAARKRVRDADYRRQHR
jgi:hypothetical protein